jgi:hypothetical protein
MRSPHLKTGWSAFLLYAAMAILLVTATVQAAHICGLKVTETSVSAQDEGGSSPAGALCTMCLLAHSVAAVLMAVMAFSPLLRRAPVRFIQPVRFIPVATSFHLYVRPPPAW